jgi:hypothetical protein
MLESKDLNFILKLEKVKFKHDCFSEEVILYADAVKIIEELQLKLASNLLEEVQKAVNSYNGNIQELQSILKETQE